jgi:hypothetical protein
MDSASAIRWEIESDQRGRRDGLCHRLVGFWKNRKWLSVKLTANGVQGEWSSSCFEALVEIVQQDSLPPSTSFFCFRVLDLQRKYHMHSARAVLLEAPMDRWVLRGRESSLRRRPVLTLRRGGRVTAFWDRGYSP